MRTYGGLAITRSYLETGEFCENKSGLADARREGSAKSRKSLSWICSLVPGKRLEMRSDAALRAATSVS